MSDKKLFKVHVGFEDGEAGTCSAVAYENAVWIVPRWLPSSDGRSAKPERMIRLDQFQHQTLDPPGPDGVDFFLNDPMPRVLFDGILTPKLKKQFVVLEKPDVIFRLPAIH